MELLNKNKKFSFFFFHPESTHGKSEKNIYFDGTASKKHREIKHKKKVIFLPVAQKYCICREKAIVNSMRLK